MKQSYYRDSIIFFGFVIPGLLALILCGGLWYAKSTITASLQQKEQAFTAAKKQQSDITQLEKQIAPQRELAKSWDQLISKDLATSLNDELTDISQGIPSREFTQTSTNPANNKGGITGMSKQNTTGFKLAFRGTYRGLQKGLLSLETRLPHLQVSDLQITPNKQNNSLSVDVTYGAWAK